MSKASRKRYMERLAKRKLPVEKERPIETAPDWSGKCENCGASPIVPALASLTLRTLQVRFHQPLCRKYVQARLRL